MQQIPCNQTQLQSYLDSAIEIAQQAGQIILEMRQHQSFSQDYKADHELVTSADLKADQLIRTQLQLQFPEHGILSEESSPDYSNTQSLYQPIWIIDPIDGTVNFAHGHAQSAVSIAHARDGDVVFGVVYNPFTDEMFQAEAGGGALLNNRPISVSGQKDLRKALIATGFPYQKDNLDPLIAQVSSILHHCADIRRLGSAALDICWLAAGRLDGYYESLSLWDFAAARLIASEAGATCGHFSVIPDGANPAFHCRDILISTPEIYGELKELLTQTVN